VAAAENEAGRLTNLRLQKERSQLLLIHGAAKGEKKLYMGYHKKKGQGERSE